MGAAVTFLMFSVLHESTHHAISTNTRVNDALRAPLGAVRRAYAPFPLLKFIHIEHHRNTNEPMPIDPDKWTSEGPWWQLPFRWMTIDLWYLVFYLRRIRERPRGEAVVRAAFAVGVAGAVRRAVRRTGTAPRCSGSTWSRSASAWSCSPGGSTTCPTTG